MFEVLDDIRREIEAAEVTSKQAAEAFRARLLARESGRISELFEPMKRVSPEERPRYGQEVNALNELAEQRLREFEERAEPSVTGAARQIDLTLPRRRPVPRGSTHPITQTLEDIKSIFDRFGFWV